MKTFSTLAIATTLLTAFPPSAAAVPEYGASNLGGSTYLTWVFQDRADANGVRGYVCITRDTLGGMARNAFANRYAIVPVPDNFYFELRPLNAVEIYPSGSGWVAEQVEPIPVDDIWANAELDESEEWFAANIPVDDLGRACVDGGIAGTVQQVEQLHQIDVRER
ncbi:hypothetical protein H6F93_07400 [Leptolyngbya sp. FACHB-671]|uniref:hypothetical protein n=1 Tax=Leptolyngbya sp. FACHB-671 TaxID=2692812 RepID=UPI00168664F3|nr:hypothetical protein [Leptolyngbya sp. FACHB-671]MBD2067355.1 hypothetical protein [Leptolyngbya sp. FACHB-671]